MPRSFVEAGRQKVAAKATQKENDSSFLMQRSASLTIERSTRVGRLCDERTQHTRSEVEFGLRSNAHTSRCISGLDRTVYEKVIYSVERQLMQKSVTTASAKCRQRCCSV